MLSFLFALALAQTDPSAGVAAPTPAAAASAQDVSDTPKGAPQDDYDFVAWCHGALTGHMALYDQVAPELKSIEQPGEVAGDAKADKAQMAAGREYLALYTRALNGVDKAHPGAMTSRRKVAETQGAAIWDPAGTAEPRTRMWSWLMWDLPGRCETASKTLMTRAGIAAAVHRAEPGGAAPSSIDDALSSGAPAPAAEAPAGETPVGGAPPGQAPAADAPAAPPADAPGLRGPQ